MRISHYYIAGSFAAIVSMSPNIIWTIFLPAALLFAIYSTLLIKIRIYNLFIISSVFFILIFISINVPSSTYYNLLFFLLLIYYLPFVDLFHERKFRDSFLKIGSIFILSSITVEALFDLDNFLQSRWIFDSYILGIFRQRGFYSEPANLGYWAAWLAYLSLLYNKRFEFFLFLIALILATSAGAFLFFAALSVSLMKNLNIRQIAILAGFMAVVVSLFLDQILAKISVNNSLSMLNRIENAQLALEYIQNQFPYPAGFGPLILGGQEIGITSFVLLIIKSFGILTLLLLPFFWKYYKAPSALIPIVLISTAVGNFWETPILFCFIFLARTQKFTQTLLHFAQPSLRPLKSEYK